MREPFHLHLGGLHRISSGIYLGALVLLGTIALITGFELWVEEALGSHPSLQFPPAEGVSGTMLDRE